MPRGFGCAHASRVDGLAAKHAVVNMAVRWWAGSTVRVESRRADTISLYGDAGVVVSASGKEKPQTDSAQIEHNSQPQPQHRLDAKSESRCPVCRLPSHPTPTTPHRPDPSKIPVDILDVIEHVSMHQRRVLCLVVDPAESRKQKTHLSAAFGLRLAVTSRPLRAPARPRLSLRHRSHALERPP
jgi:hypothetical protein